MLQEPCGLLLNKLGNHVAKHGSDGVETLVCGTDVVQPMIIKENLLDNEYSNGFAELRSRLHNSKAKRNDLGSKEEVDDIRGIIFDKGSDNTKRGQSQVFEGPRL